MIKKLLMTVCAAIFPLTNCVAQIKGESIEYSVNGTKMVGYVAYDENNMSKRPAILIVHDWMGIGDFTKQKADQLAKEGYVAFAVDIYGEGKNPANTEEAEKIATKFKQDRYMLRQHIRAAYNKLLTLKQVNPKKILVMGYCFGGTTALELARSGVPLAGTVSFHGGLSSPTPKDAKNIHGRVLILHGADDPFESPEEIAEFKKYMKRYHIDMKFIAYPGAVHAFTNPKAGNDNSKGMAYNQEADRNSWEAFEKFLKEVFSK